MKKLHFGRIARWTAILPVLFYILLLPMALAAPEDYSDEAPNQLRADMLYGAHAVLLDADKGDVLFEKAAYDHAYPASTTKIMTLLLAVETGWDLDLTVQIPAEAADIPQDSSLIPVYPGETVSFRDLLYGIIMHSGNDGANSVAVLVAGSVPAFVERMNARAQQLGCRNTHFVNPHGYHDENHYTCAYDLALITQEALKHDVIREIVATPRITINVSPRGEIPLYSTNYMISPTSNYYYADCIGVKTGSHTAAGKCFVGAAEKDGAHVIAVTLGADTDQGKWTDTKRLFDYGFSCFDAYDMERMFEMTSGRIINTRVSNAAKDDPYGGQLQLKLAQISSPDYARLIRGNDDETIRASMDDFVARCSVNIEDSLTAPIPAGKLVGSFTYTAQDGSIITAALVAGRDIEAEPERLSLYDLFPFLEAFGNPLVQILIIVVVLLIAVLAVHASAARRRREKRRRELYERRRREYDQRQSQKRRRAKQEDPYDDLFDE